MDTQIFSDLITDLPKSSLKLKIARVPEVMEKEDIHLDAISCLKYANPVEENILDWRYPARVLSPHLVSQKTGKKFQNVRTACNKINEQDISVRKYEQADYNELVRVSECYTDRFLEKNKAYPLTKEQMMDSMLDMLDFALNSKDIVESYVMTYKGRPEALHVIDPVSDKTNNLLWFLYNRNITGLSYMQMAHVCEKLDRRGVERLNIGGSETEGMDRFKRNFRPVQSFPLQSIDIKMRQDDMVQSTKNTYQLSAV